MIKNAKLKGTIRERKSMELLESQGYRCTRSGASLGAWDIVAVGPADIVLVQVKSNRPPGPADREELREFPAPANARKLIHVWKPRARGPEVREV